MVKTSTCPDGSTLRKLAIADLPPDEMELLLGHLQECNVCLAKLPTLATPDTLVDALAKTKTLPSDPDDPLLAGLIERLAKLGRTATPDPAPVTAAVADMRTVPPAPNPEPQTIPPTPSDTLDKLTPAPASKPDATMGLKVAQPGYDASLIDFLAPPQADDELGRLGEYRILQILGHGGMGVVFKAEDPKLKRRVAIKAMLPTLAASASSAQRFLREAQAMAAVEHDHIVRIYRVAEDRGVPFLAMEFLKGEPLDERLKSAEPLPLADLLRIGREIAEALGAAHATGLIHRDIKPGNIWLESRSDKRPRLSAGETTNAAAGRYEGRVKILDFGLARAASQEAGLTQQGAIIGTPAYMAPEQGRGDTIDARCDLFSLGVVLYRMSTGQQPFGGSDTVSTLMSVAMYEPDPPIVLNAELPPALSELVMKLLEKDPKQRIATADEVVQAVHALEKDLARKTAATRDTSEESYVPSTSAAGLKAWAADSPATGAAAPQLRAPARGKRPLVIAALVLLAVLGGGTLAAIVIYWQTNNGIVRIEINDPDIKVAFDKNGPTLSGAATQDIKLTPGEFGLHIERGDLKFDTDKFILKRGETITLKIEWFKEGKLQVVQGDKVIGAKQRPKVDVAVAPGGATKQQPKTVTPQVKDPPKDKDKPFLLVRPDGKRLEFASFIEAVAVVQTGDIVEVFGNGPFPVPYVEINDRSLDLRAAPGYRPLFVAMEKEIGDRGIFPSWFVLKNSALRLEGCDFHWGNRYGFGGGGQPWEMRNCRFFNLGHGQHTRLGGYAGPSLRINDCLMATSGGLDLGPDVLAELTNNLSQTAGLIRLDKEGGQTVRLVSNTCHTKLVVGWRTEDGKANPAKPVQVEARGNAFDLGVICPLISLADQKIRWHGQDNLYITSIMAGAEGKAPIYNDLAAWMKLTGSDETGSKQVAGVRYQWHRFFQEEFEKMLPELQTQVEELKKKHRLPELGPQWDLIGPGESYVRALEASGRPVPKDQLRPAAPPSGTFVVLRAGKIAAALRTFQDACNALQDGDILEIRSDGSFPGARLNAGKTERVLTIRAAPGYRPVVEGEFRVHKPDRVTIEGLLFRKGCISQSSGQSQVVRIANCAFENNEIFRLGLYAEPGRPAEIVNCWLPGIAILARSTGDKLVLRNSVFGIVTTGQDTEIERCAFWSTIATTPLVLAADQQVTARATVFQASSFGFQVTSGPPVRWSGTANLYLVGKHGFLDELRDTYKSPETGSAVGLPHILNPQEWRLIPEQPFGADVDKILRRPGP